MADMAVCSVDFHGQALGRLNNIEVIVPQAPGPFAVMYLLHGMGDDHTSWHRGMSMVRYLQELNLMAVMVNGARSFYTNDPRSGGYAYEDHVVKDVVGFVDATFPTVAKRQARGLAGYSMGGYGAMMLALRHPDMFSVVSAHSSALFFGHADQPPEETYDDDLMRALPPGEYDCFALARRSPEKARELAIRFDCGRDDSLLEASRSFHAHLEKLEIPHEYVEHDGGHDWVYWDTHIRRTLEFAVENLKTGSRRPKRS